MGPEVARALYRGGWYLHHQTGSHLILRHPDRPGMRATVPMHSGKVIRLGTLAKILESAGLTIDEFTELL